MRLVPMTFAFLALCGCASFGHAFSLEQANRVTNGMTREEVIKVMGSNPTAVTAQGKVFLWTYSKGDFLGRAEARTAKFSFDENGKAYGIPEGGVAGDAAAYLPQR